MRLLVDEMPYYKDDCLFTEQKWSDEEETWVCYCKLTSAICDLDEEQCSCLKAPKIKDEPQTETQTETQKSNLSFEKPQAELKGSKRSVKGSETDYGKGLQLFADILFDKEKSEQFLKECE